MTNELEALTEEIKSWRDGQQEEIDTLRKLLIGNGDVGLCETVRGISKQIKPLWALVGIIGAAILTGLIKLLFFT